MQLYYILVAELVEVADLSVGALGIDRVLEGIEYLLQCEGAASTAVGDLPNVSVGARSHLLGETVSS